MVDGAREVQWLQRTAGEPFTRRASENADNERMSPNRRTVRPDELASIRQRALAYLVDLLLVGGGVFAIVRNRERSSANQTTAFVVLGTVLGTLYHVLLEGSGGRTVGKAVVGIRVVRDDGSNCTHRAAVVRTVFRFVDALPVAYLAGLLSILLTERRQRLGDAAAKTVVVRTDE